MNLVTTSVGQRCQEGIHGLFRKKIGGLCSPHGITSPKSFCEETAAS